MIPTPQYPLYSAALAEYGLGQTGYYLDEEHGWGLSEEELERSYNEGMKQYNVRAIVIINPGNPTGQVIILFYWWLCDFRCDLVVKVPSWYAQ